MPVYEYVCNACGKEAEYQQRMADPDKTVCEACGKEALERIISRTAFQLKGGGWYKDLYSSSKPEPAKTDAKPDAGAKTDAAAPAPSTPAAPAPSAPAAPSTPSTGSSSGSSGSGSSGSGSSGSGGSSSSGGGSAAT